MTKTGVRTLALLGAAAWLGAAAPMPVRRAGLWEMHMVGGPMGRLDMSAKSCADPARDKADAAFAGGRHTKDCTPAAIAALPGGGWSYHTVCKPGNGMTMDISGTATGDFQTGYIVRSTTRMSPAPMPSMAETHMTVTAHWLGACPAGMKPGDTQLESRALPAMRPHPPR